MDPLRLDYVQNSVSHTEPNGQIREILDSIDLSRALKGDPKSVNEFKELYKSNLNRAYQLLIQSDRSLPLLADIMTKYGRLRYAEQYPACMVMMRGSLNAQLTAIGIGTLNFEVGGQEDLPSFESTLFNHSLFSSFDNWMLTSDMEAVASQIEGMKLEPKALYQMGYTLSWLANGFLHTEGFKPEDNEKRFSQVYDLCEKLLTMADTPEAKLELAEMYYNGRRGQELDKDNIEAAHKWLDKAMELNTSLEMAARVANLKMVDWFQKGDLEKATVFCTRAIEIRQSFPKELQDPFLIANLNNNKVALLMKQGKLEEADREIDPAIAYSTECRAQNDDRQYFGIYDMTKAKIKLAKGELEAAIQFIGSALQTFHRHEQDSKALIENASRLHRQIEEAMQK